MKIKTITTILLVLFSVTVTAVEVSPFERAEITEEQWSQYHSAVNKELSNSRRAYEKHYLEVYSDDVSRASIAFTMLGHKAHPAWVTRQVVMDGESISMQVIGYFAGDEEAFNVLFKQYQEMASRTQQKFKR